jgi:aldose 1-epimerase
VDSPLPSGRQIELSHGAQRAIVVEVGGGLRAYSVDGHAVLAGYDDDAMCDGGRGQVLMPWPNRIRDGRYAFEGQAFQLPLSEPANHNAIHGLVRWATWTTASVERHRVVMQHRLHPQPGYPFALDLTVEYTLDEQGLRVRTSALNIGQTRCPFGSGAHPYLTVGVDPVDGVELSVPGRTRLRADGAGIPVAAEPVADTPFDLRHGVLIGDRKLDDGFTDLERDADGLARAHLAGLQGGRRVSLWVDEAYAYLMVFTGDTLSRQARAAVAIEPMTGAPDAFNSGDGLITLEPGQSFTGSWGIQAVASTS